MDAILNAVEPMLRKVPLYFTPKGAILAMFALVYLSKSVQATLSFMLVGKYDNVQSTYRSTLVSKQDSWGKKTVCRAYAAHENQWEAFIGFAAAVILALQCKVNSEELTYLCNSFLMVRVVYNIVFVLAFNEPLSFIRSSVFMVGIMIVIKIFYMCL